MSYVVPSQMLTYLQKNNLILYINNLHTGNKLNYLHKNSIMIELVLPNLDRAEPRLQIWTGIFKTNVDTTT